MRNAWNWLLTSSADPKKTGAWVKGLAILAGSQVVRVVNVACDFGLTCLGVTQEHVNSFAEGAELFVTGAMIIIGLGVTLFGLGRKAYYARWSHPNA